MSTAQLSARRTLAAKSKSFALAARLLGSRVRDDAAVLYAWCRRVDDAVDEAPDAAAARAALAREVALLDRVYGDTPLEDLELEALREVFRRARVPKTYPQELLEGMRMDVEGRRYRTFDELLLYCYRVAGVVGLMMAHVMGVSRERALRNACHLGIAMQLTNIARDVREDLERGRMYLPDELVASAPLGENGMKAGARALLQRADAYYRSADEGVGALPWRCALAVRTARQVYAAIGAVIAERGFDVMAGRAVVGSAQKFWLLVRAAAQTAADLVRGRWRFQPVALPEEVRAHEVIRL